MEWKKSPPDLVELFARVAPGPPAEQKKMFGYPAAFLNGNLFISLFQDQFVLRLPDDERAKLMKIAGARAFEPMPGRPMKDYVVAPPSIVADEKKLRQWISRAAGYAASLPAKQKKAKSSRAKRG